MQTVLRNYAQKKKNKIQKKQSLKVKIRVENIARRKYMQLSMSICKLLDILGHKIDFFSHIYSSSGNACAQTPTLVFFYLIFADFYTL